jgi:hypothetical protein
MYTAEPYSRLQQGCIIEGLWFHFLQAEIDAVVLSPACDVAQNKADFATCVGLFPFEEQILKFKEGDWAKKHGEANGQPIATPTRKQSDRFADDIRDLMNNRFPRYHWFDRTPTGRGPWVADFQVVTSVPQVDFDELTVLASLNSQYMEQLPARYVAYTGRIGVPDRAPESYEEHIEAAKTLFYGLAVEETRS